MAEREMGEGGGEAGKGVVDVGLEDETGGIDGGEIREELGLEILETSWMIIIIF